MKTLLLAAAAAGLATAALAQAPAAPRPVEPPSNTQTGVSINRYIGDASKSPATVYLDTMMKHTILTAGDPLQPGPDGAVLRRRKDISLLTLEGGENSSLGRSADQMVFYVEAGTGRLDDGKSSWPLKPGVLALAPPGVGHRFHNSGDTQLKIISVTIPVEARVTPKTEMIVRDVDKMAMTERNVHWSNMAKYVLVGERDGLFPSDRVYLVYMSPMTIAGPHAHTPDQEEVWIKVTEGASIMQLGSEIRPWPVNAGFLAPPNGQTVHAAYNLADHRQAWLYVARLNADPPATPPTPQPGREPPPAIAEGLAASNIAPTPLNPPATPRR